MTNSLGQEALDLDGGSQSLFAHFDGAHVSPERPPQPTMNEAKASIDALVRDGLHYRFSSQYRDLVEFIKRFRQYSPFNGLLVHLQDPGAAFVATPAHWRSNYGRKISELARPIVILRPKGPVMVVFDVRHTEPDGSGGDLPLGVLDPMAAAATLPDYELHACWERLLDNAKRDGIRIRTKDEGHHSAGYARVSAGDLLVRPPSRPGDIATTHPLRFDIVVNANDPIADQLATLLHELGHIYCGHLGTRNPKHWESRLLETKETREFEAESVAYIAMSRFDPKIVMGRHISQIVTSMNEIPPIGLQVVLRTAGLLIEMATKRLPDRSDPPRAARRSRNGNQ
ncbi:ImmA/IrrE family metallo-endopeptidase [Paraoerskovia marina]|nr:ImmA/IrrE family metallo-endopeptidase [Paraoerskovia marina]